MTNIEEKIKIFQRENNITQKGPLSVVIQLTNLIKSKTFPLDANDFKTEQEGQVSGLGGGKLKKILKEYGITQTLSSEGGRTSRGSMGLMIKYIEFLNTLHTDGPVDLDTVEYFWAEQVKEYFRNKPFTLSSDAAKTIVATLNELFDQAKKRQKENPGTQYLGTVLQHLVAAKLSLILPEKSFQIYGSSVADGPTDRKGDFVINRTAIHCTTMPSLSLIEKCQDNIRGNYHPVIITISDRVSTALNLAEDANLEGRIEVWDIQQFLSTNIYEHSFFDDTKRTSVLTDIIARYNDIVQKTETDPSLRIEFGTH